MAHVDEVVTTSTHDQLKALAVRHSTFGDYMHDVEMLAEKMWHNSRSQAEVDKRKAAEAAQAEQDAINAVTEARRQHSIVGDAKPRATEATSPAAEDNAVQQTPAEPASPQSEGGFPTSNVGVQVPEESQPAS
jgi:hypothetical protein